MELNKFESCDFCYNGDEAFNKAVDSIKKAISEADGKAVRYLRPVNLMLLDF
jgi:hypothetical protein